MPVQDTSGGADGLGSVSSTTAILFGIGGISEGSSKTRISVPQIVTGYIYASGLLTHGNIISLPQIVSGAVHGSSSMTGDMTRPVAGETSGASTVSGSIVRMQTIGGIATGTSSLVYIVEYQHVQGSSSVVSHVDVEEHLPAINAIVAPPKAFYYLQLLQRGDLPIYICDKTGPIAPARVTYTMFFVRSNSTRVQVGPGSKSPAKGEVGEYYAVGRAGERGQPGCWVIRWEFQRFIESDVETIEMEFRVEDSVLENRPCDSLTRVQKYGWN
jgi:hypothetical protein